MTISTVYIAEDGHKFFDEDECIKHEWEVRFGTINGPLKVFDDGMTKLPLNSKLNCDSIFYIKAETQEAIDIMRHYFEFQGYNGKGLEKPGYFYFDELSCCWFDLRDQLTMLIDALEAMKED
jgi:hypothetical protein